MSCAEFCAGFSLQGPRETMQDRLGVRWQNGVLLAVVCDGCGPEGDKAAEIAVNSLLRDLPEGGGQDHRDFIRQVFAAVSREIRDQTNCSTTATAVWLSQGQLSVAYVGDSEVRALSHRGQFLQLTPVLHHPDEPLEKARIEAAGGKVIGDRICVRVRVDDEDRVSRFGLSRCLGGARHNGLVTAEPDFCGVANGMLRQIEHLLVGSDGLHGTMDDASITYREFRARVSGRSLADKAHCLSDFLAELYPGDNIAGFLINPRPFVSV